MGTTVIEKLIEAEKILRDCVSMTEIASIHFRPLKDVTIKISGIIRDNEYLKTLGY